MLVTGKAEAASPAKPLRASRPWSRIQALISHSARRSRLAKTASGCYRLDRENIAAGRGKTTAVVVCGDLNDEVEAATTQIIQGPSGSEIGTAGFAQGDQSDGFRMWNLAPLLPNVGNAPAFTRRYKGRGELIDHIFASHVLVNPNNRPMARTIMNPDPLPSMGDDPNARRNEPGSDHAAVVAIFDV
jgi:Endonuclease/Exonuclease/phosphatase family